MSADKPQPAVVTRFGKERLTMGTTTDCCGTSIVRPRVVGFMACDYCGTKLSWTDKGWPFVKFGEEYLRRRKEKVEGIYAGERGVRVDLEQMETENSRLVD